MNLTILAFEQISSMLLIMLIGVACYKLKMIDDHANKRLSRILLEIVNPLVIFLSYQRDFDMSLFYGLLWSIALALLLYAITIPLSIFFLPKTEDCSHRIERLCSVYGNCGFMGLPLVLGIFGSEGVFYVTAFMTVFNIIIWTFGVNTLTEDFSSKAVYKALQSPAIIATVVGFAFFMLQIRIPTFFDEPLSLVAGMNTPLAMIIAGVSLCQSDFVLMLKNKRIYYVCFLKLILYPSIMLILFRFIPIDPLILNVSLTICACPTATTAILFSYRYKQDTLYTTQIFSVSTILSLITIPIILFFAV